MNETRPCTANPCPVTLALVTAARAAETRAEAALAALGLSLAKVNVLRHLVAERAPIALGELAERNACVRSNITQLVDRLEAEGLVLRVADAADRRSVLAEATAEGRRRYTAAMRVLDSQERTLVRELGASEASDVLRVLERVGSAG